MNTRPLLAAAGTNTARSQKSSQPPTAARYSAMGSKPIPIPIAYATAGPRMRLAQPFQQAIAPKPTATSSAGW